MKKDLILLVLLILPAFAPLMQKGYFTMHDDLQSMRQLEVDKCFRDRQIPCRWNTDMGYGYGYPLFNYYPPFPYYLGQVFRFAGFQYIDVVKLMGILGFVASATFMYLLARDFWGRLGGLVSAVFYTYAPYHSVDFYVRGAINEFWALAFYPVIFWTTYRLILDSHPKWIIWVTLSVVGLMLSHNPMLMIFAPIYLVWIFFWLWKSSSILDHKSYIHLTVSALWALGLAAFFTLPVIFEAKFVSIWTLTSGYFNYLAHFLDISQIFFRINWGYGQSVYGPDDTMSFALGYLHWIIPVVILLFIFSKKFLNHRSLIIYLTLVTLGSLFMAHFKSTPIWLLIKPLEFLQFPWRFLTLSVFSVSLLCGAISMFVSKPKFLISGVLGLVIMLNANYFQPRQWLPNMTDEQKFLGHSWQLLITSGIFDYLPIWAPLPPIGGQGEELKFITGSGVYTVDKFRTNIQKYQVQASQSATLELQTFYFPGWRVWLDKLEVPIDPTRDPILGRMQVDVSQGNHDLTARFMDTPIRFIADSISLIAWAILVLYFVPWPKKLH